MYPGFGRDTVFYRGTVGYYGVNKKSIEFEGE